jgi:predicted Rossmann fold nucleotide-binding protein DprA/Smf involved in DNA uptake
MAQLITESADLINSLNWEKENNVDYSDNFIEENMDILDLSIPENRVISLLLKNGKYHFDQILASIDLKTNELNSLLFNMELLGSIHSHPGKIYSIQGR